MTHRRRQVLTGSVVGVLAVAVGAVALSLSGTTPEAETGDGDLPPLISRHLEALPDDGGLEGPGGAADQAFLERAYPAGTISVAQMDTARAAYTASKGRPFPGGKGQKGTWVSVGPSEALYPSSQFLSSFNYVPNAYVAGGRTTSIAISDTCVPRNCRVYITPAGGGVWRTQNALDAQPNWAYLGGPLGINAAGAITIDRNDPTGNTVWVGTGEANICGSGCVAGVGLYKSTNGGDTWTGPIGKPEFAGKGIGEIVFKPGDSNTIYVGSTTALTGMSAVCCTGVTRPTPGAAKWGLYKSTDGGANWAFIHNGSADVAQCTGDLNEFINNGVCSPRGVRHVELDPSNPNIVYAGSYARGIWRSPDGGTTWTQIKPSLNPAIIQTRPAFDVAALPNGKTRMYVHEGNIGTPISQLSRSDDVATGVPTFTNLTSANPADPGFAWANLCTGQCWYDLFVTSPDGHPDMVYAGGSYSYGQVIANKRGVVLSTDAGVTGTDMTFDGTDFLHPNGLHPDQHDVVVNPNNPFQFFEANDGGVMRSSGTLVDRSAFCDDPRRNLTNPTQLARCRQMLSAVPSQLKGINQGLSTLQFMHLSVNPFNSEVLQGGTQDNGTWETDGNKKRWENMMIGDGGWSGFDIDRPEFRFHTFTGTATDVNFNNGYIGDWIYVGGGQMGRDGGSNFYAPVISDPTVSGTMFAGTGVTAYRTKTFGLGTRTLAEANAICNEWTGSSQTGAECGDFARLGPTPLTDVAWGTRAGPAVAALERTTADNSTAWAATTTGRVFITKNVDAEPVEVTLDSQGREIRTATAVNWTRLDDDAVTPNRFISSIHIDPANANHAWISYSGYNSNTPDTPGHVFEVTYNPATGTSTWIDRSYDVGDIPITELVRDDVTGDLYAGTDFGPIRLAAGTTTWTKAAPGMPNVEITGLTILPGERILYAATHGLSAWRLNLN
ncbi:MAG: exo-alpha-sialidase [Actinomycetes bacterium]